MAARRRLREGGEFACGLRVRKGAAKKKRSRGEVGEDEEGEEGDVPLGKGEEERRGRRGGEGGEVVGEGVEGEEESGKGEGGEEFAEHVGG